MGQPLRKGGIIRLGSASCPDRCRPGTEQSSGASPSTATVTCECSSCKQPGSFCCGQRTGRSTVSAPGWFVPLNAYIPTFWLRPSPTSWHGLPGPCWCKSATMRRASQGQQPNEHAQVHQGDGRRPLSPPSLARSGQPPTAAPRGRL